MGQSIGSIGNSKKQAGSGDQAKNQPEFRPGQKMSDQGGEKAEGRPGQKMSDQRGAARGGKPDGGADHGARSRR